jgi:hypothetical protein
LNEYISTSRQLCRTFKGEKPGDLPVINSKTAEALSLTLPQVLLALANELMGAIQKVTPPCTLGPPSRAQKPKAQKINISGHSSLGD